MKNSSRLAVVALGGVALLALAGCAGDASATPTEDASKPAAAGTLAYSPTSVQVPVLAETGNVIEGLAGEAGWGYTLIDGAFDPANQSQQIIQALDNGSVQALWVTPVAGPAALPLVEHAQKLGVPTLVQTLPADLGLDGPQPGLAFQGPDFVAYGEALGEEVNNCVADKGLSEPEAILITGPDTLPGTSESKAAAAQAFAGSVTVVAETQAADVAAAQTQTQQLLTANPGAKVVIALTDEGALGAINAYKVAGLTPDCVILGGGGPDAMAAQESGDITAVVAWDFMGAVPQGWAALEEIIADPKAEGAVLNIPFNVTK